jgi:type II secretion system protein H
MDRWAMTTTLQTGRGDRDSRAFTLIELILVMALLAVVISVSVPSLRGFFQGRNLDSEARRFLTLTHYAQSRAVSEGIPMTLWIDAEHGTYGLQAAGGYLREDPRALEYSLAPNLKIEVSTVALTAFAGGWGPVPASMAAEPVIRFMPDGFIGLSSPDRVEIRQSEDDAILIMQTSNRLSYAIQQRQ